jgi:PPOX class probable F420-dependent enzyme
MAALDQTACRERLRSARVGRLATVTADGLPHVVPCCFVASQSGDDNLMLYSVVDGKPKTTTSLKRLDNIRANPAASLVVDHYDDDWSTLWWVRADGPTIIVDPAPSSDRTGSTGSADRASSADEREAALAALADKYQQYRSMPPDGALLRIDVSRLTGWTFR